MTVLDVDRLVVVIVRAVSDGDINPSAFTNDSFLPPPPATSTSAAFASVNQQGDEAKRCRVPVPTALLMPPAASGDDGAERDTSNEGGSGYCPPRAERPVKSLGEEEGEG
mmetsp:Transcript_36991/g.78903  ORF Transcript_36991/g.78903 Transcript_36991/m.78903 type:complete len:110 (+) Transcript_36991:320-649(+)